MMATPHHPSQTGASPQGEAYRRYPFHSRQRVVGVGALDDPNIIKIPLRMTRKRIVLR